MTQQLTGQTARLIGSASGREGREPSVDATITRSRAAVWTNTAYLTVAFVYFLVVGHRPVVVAPLSGYDDGLYMRLAMEIVSGHWLGAYDGLTLAKGSGFPLFLALNYLIGLPVGFALSLTYAVASAYFCRVLRAVVGSDLFCIALYGAILFVPPLASSITTPVERDFFYAALVLAFLSAAVHLAVSPRSSWLIAVLAGVLGGWTWLTREEGVWILPTLGALFALALFKRSPSTLLRPFLLWTAALSVSASVVAFYGLTNRLVYGRFVISEIKSNPFQSAMTALELASYPDWRPYVPVPAPARQRIYAESPTFRMIQPILDPPDAPNGWTNWGCGALPQSCGDISGGAFLWAFRGAADYVGKFGSPKAADVFYAAVASEVRAACTEGRLICARWLFPLVPPVTLAQVRSFPETLLRTFERIAMIQPIETGWVGARVTGLDRRFTELLASPGYGPGRVVLLDGSYDESEISKLNVLPSGDSQVLELSFSGSVDPSQTTAPTGGTHRRFSAVVSCPREPCQVSLANSTGNRADLVLAMQGDSELRLGDSTVYLEKPQSSAYTLRTRFANLFNTNLPRLRYAYIVLVLLGAVSFIVNAIGNVVSRRIPTAFGISAVFGVAVVSRGVLIALMDATSFVANTNWYLSPTFPLVVAMSALSLWSLGDRCKGIVKLSDEANEVLPSAGGHAAVKIAAHHAAMASVRKAFRVLRETR